MRIIDSAIVMTTATFHLELPIFVSGCVSNTLEPIMLHVLSFHVCTRLTENGSRSLVPSTTFVIIVQNQNEFLVVVESRNLLPALLSADKGLVDVSHVISQFYFNGLVTQVLFFFQNFWLRCL